jgi:phospholipid transport system substrate-binding protein
MRTLATLTLSLLSCAALAAEEAPDVLMRRISDEVIETIRQDKAVQAGDAQKIAAVVEAKVLPHFDFRRATQLAVGSGWRLANDAQREQLVREFRTLLVRTYSGALAGYRGQTIELMPLRMRPGDAEVTVRSRIKQPGVEPIVVEYDMEKTADSWKVYDVRVGGMSLVATYRSAFAEEVRNHGVDGLIAVLAAKNGRSS